MIASFDTVDIWGWIILCSGDYLVLCRMFSGIPGLRPLDASSIPVVMTNRHICRYCQMSPGGSISPSLGPPPSLLVVLNLHPAPLPNASPSHSSFVNGRFVVVFFFFHATFIALRYCYIRIGVPSSIQAQVTEIRLIA